MITHLQAVQLVKKHVEASSLAATKTAWGRELKLAKQLTTGRYEEYSFWIDLGLGFQLQSLCWFKTPDGIATLERAWRLYQFEKVERERIRKQETLAREMALDSILNPDSIESELPQVPPPKRETPISWADS